MWELKNDRPIYSQIVEKIKIQIISGKYKAGDKLESVRDLALKAAVNPNTMQKALAQLESEGLVYSERTSGRYITQDINMINELKKQEANAIITDFLKQMESFGMDKNEVINMINSVKEF